MEIYLVGGAVRDELLGLPIKEKDYVVVGATVQEMLQKGYQQVGKDFPVFLHPRTKEEYALARTERKISKGYTGFSFDSSEKVTLEEDLLRRDLTINAIAKSADGAIIDPYHGQRDLQAKQLRHISKAFAEDPVRILRAGRFLSRFASLGFSLANETIQLMREMVEAGEVNALVPERVWKEWEKSLREPHPEKFFEVLHQAMALKILFPELDTVSFTNLAIVSQKTQDPIIRFAALMQNLSSENIQTICKRYRIPNEYRELALIVQKNIIVYGRVDALTAEEIVTNLQATDAFRRESRYLQYLKTAEFLLNTPAVTKKWLSFLQQVQSINVKSFASGLIGKEIAEKLFAERVKVINNVINIKPLGDKL